MTVRGGGGGKSELHQAFPPRYLNSSSSFKNLNCSPTPLKMQVSISHGFIHTRPPHRRGGQFLPSGSGLLARIVQLA